MEMTSLKRVTISPKHDTSTTKDGRIYGGVFGGALGDAKLVEGMYAPSLSQRLQISTGSSRNKLAGSLVRFKKAVKKVQMVARFRHAGEVHARFKHDFLYQEDHTSPASGVPMTPRKWLVRALHRKERRMLDGTLVFLAAVGFCSVILGMFLASQAEANPVRPVGPGMVAVGLALMCACVLG